MLSQSLAVLGVLALLFAALWLAKSKGLAALTPRLAGRGGGSAERQLQVIERVALSAQHSLHLVSCAGRLIMVGVSPAGCSTLATFDQETAPPPAAADAAGGAR